MDDQSIICLHLMLCVLCLLVLVCTEFKRIDLPLKWLVHLLVRYQEQQKSKFKTTDWNSTENALTRMLVKDSTFIWNPIGQCAWWPNCVLYGNAMPEIRTMPIMKRSGCYDITRKSSWQHDWTSNQRRSNDPTQIIWKRRIIFVPRGPSQS